MTQFSYPGVYIQEFTPGPPIEGIGTSTVAFVGTALSGPRTATRLHSWEAFQATFGGFLTEQPASYLAPAVYGFFLNGGTDCFILRASAALTSFAHLLSRRAGSAEAVLVAEAVEEGFGGDGVTVEVRDASLLDDMLGAGAQTLQVHFASSPLTDPLPTAATADRRTVRVGDNTAFRVGERVVFDDTGTVTPAGVVASRTGTKTVVLAAQVPGTGTFGGATLRSADLDAGQREILVDLPAGFRLDRALPRGATVRIAATGLNPDISTVRTTGTHTGWGSITVTRGLSQQYVLTTHRPTVASLEFDLIVAKDGAVAPDGTPIIEEFRTLSMNPEHPAYWGSLVRSQFLTLREPDQPPAHPADDPRPLRPSVNPTVHLSGGADDDRAQAWSDLENDPADELARLDPHDEIDLVCIPGATKPSAQQGLLAYCELKRDRLAILDATFGATAAQVSAQVDAVRGDHLGYAALYHPWILARNPVTNQNQYWPPSGHIAGIYARTDARSGVHTAPANATIRGALGLQSLLSDAEQGPLNLTGINVLRVFPGQSQPVVWGARTTATQNRYWQYVNIRRLFLFVEKSIQQNLRWAMFQPNNLALWQQLKRVIGDFLTKAWRDGALFGATAKDAYYVRIDEALNPESERALGRLHIEIGLAPAYPAEFIVVRIGIWQGGSEVSEG
ncbi:phage tail sheath subtilisin-like domain-containing protein [Actinoplanes sp. NPDC026623]|uniref:phage tail sheath subtilisin-like domain-containing protein n=1 Tax=Actinoplanes sp. NPDC026623 TaxID=3155610 RepID=UPI0033C17118